jgi:hypothetical protein
MAGSLLSYCVVLPAELQTACLPPSRLKAFVRLRNESLISPRFFSPHAQKPIEDSFQMLGKDFFFLNILSFIVKMRSRHHLACVVVRKEIKGIGCCSEMNP